MKTISTVIGALSGGVLSFLCFSLISWWQMRQLGYEPRVSDQLIDTFLLCTPFLMMFTGWLGYRRARKSV